MLGFVPPIKEKKKKRDEDLDCEDEVLFSFIIPIFLIYKSIFAANENSLKHNPKLEEVSNLFLLTLI